MKLKKVVILGFKSFAERTVIEFHEGITCVVGPNGCGKSNIADAIRWVLGEQSAKAMRGGKMPDLIFAGASSKKAVDFAEVTIVFSEVQGTLHFDEEEISITRRLHRNGESLYLINQQQVRLRDVHALFLDSGIGKSNFSFFEQGKIDQLIHYSPEERRTIFEEAAGIVRFLQRKRETLRKLEDVDLNLLRVVDIKGEVEKQILLLEGQAEAASLYREKKERLESFEKELLLVRYTRYVEKKTDLKAKESEIKKTHLESLEKKEFLESDLETKKSAHEELEKKGRKIQELLLSLHHERNLKNQSKSHSEERIHDFLLKEEKFNQERTSLKEKLSEWTDEMAVLKGKRETLSHEVVEAKKQEALLNGEFQVLEKELHLLRKKQTEAYQGKIAAFQAQSQLQTQLKTIAFRMEANLEKKEHLEERSQSLLQLIDEKKETFTKSDEIRLRAQENVIKGKERLSLLEETLQKKREEIVRYEKELFNIQKVEQEKAAHLRALMHLKQAFTGFSSGGKALLQAAQQEKNPLFGLLKGLYEAIEPKEGYEKAVNTILKSYSQTLVAQTTQDFERVLSYAKEHSLSDFSLLCLEQVPQNPSNSPFCVPSPLASHFLSDINSWTASGYFIDAKGVLFAPAEQESSPFLREAEIKALEKELEEVSCQKTKTQETLTLLIQEKEGLEGQKKDIEQELRKIELAAVEANFAAQKVHFELERMIKEKAQVEEEAKGLLESVQKVIQEREKITGEFDSANTKIDTIQNQLGTIEQELALKNGMSSNKKQALLEATAILQRCDAEYRRISHQFHVLDAKIAETSRLVIRLEEELKMGQASSKQWQAQVESASIDLIMVQEQLEKAEKETKETEAFRLHSKTALVVLEKEHKELGKTLREIENKLHQLGIQLSSVETGENAVRVEARERFDIAIETISSANHLSSERLENEIQALKGYLEQNQNVNLAAIDECVKQKERAQFLTVQCEDLTCAKEELLKMIGELDQESRDLFKATFEQIRHHFQKNFQILFKGGEADLELLESKDILEAGIEIIAQPPGKQMRSLSLLSGGEKCLTAMALLFALFEVKSSPFCVLDEIDAPLDDSNVERFLNVVKQFTDRCQFIIVSHNKRTMALADRLYGVTMEEKGISKILSMEFSGKSPVKLLGV